ncbi:MAG TPA: zinc-ribbon domain-containing protein [Candidatus Saccharimonadales bacterium]|nr:zinc-ribbon domain-containing protein [Candidatus Saccharimonadales bacterium]
MGDASTLLTVCPHCRRRYRVRAEHVPPQGVSARCPHCGAVFPIVPRIGAAVPAAPGQPPGPAAGRPAVTPAGSPRLEAEPAPPARRAVPAARGAAVPARAAAAAAGAPAPGRWSVELERARPERGAIGEVRPRPWDPNGRGDLAAGGPGGLPGEAEDAAAGDPHAHARSLARALASDLAGSHPEEIRRGREGGRLVRLLAAEIARSWELYRREVGDELALTTAYFRDALNEYLAAGEPYF